MRRTYEFDKLVVANFSAPPDSPPDAGDTDSDGLLDAEEIDAGTIPWVVDTDGDGFSDGVEAHFSTLGAASNPVTFQYGTEAFFNNTNFFAGDTVLHTLGTFALADAQGGAGQRVIEKVGKIIVTCRIVGIEHTIA